MGRLWLVVNLLLVASGIEAGYASLRPEGLRHTNPDAVLCGIILLLMPLFSLGVVAFSSERRKVLLLRRPSLVRNPLNWWGDPLQSLFITTSVTAGMAIGAALRHPVSGSVGFWTVGVDACFAIGLSVGQVLVYQIYRHRIAPV